VGDRLPWRKTTIGIEAVHELSRRDNYKALIEPTGRAIPPGFHLNMLTKQAKRYHYWTTGNSPRLFRVALPIFETETLQLCSAHQRRSPSYPCPAKQNYSSSPTQAQREYSYRPQPRPPRPNNPGSSHACSSLPQNPHHTKLHQRYRRANISEASDT
jgi:hypothetical protein